MSTLMPAHTDRSSTRTCSHRSSLPFAERTSNGRKDVAMPGTYMGLSFAIMKLLF